MSCRRPQIGTTSRRSVAIAAVGLGLVTAIVSAVVGISAVDAQEAEDEPLPFGTLGLELTDHTIDVGANGDLTLTYEIVGGLADAELLFIDQADDTATDDDEAQPTTDEPSTGTAPATTTVGAVDSATTNTETPADDSATTTSSTSTTTTTTVPDAPPPPIPLSVDVIIDDRIDEVDDLIGRLGSTATPAVFQSPTDGIQIPDIRPAITIEDDGRAMLQLTVGTDTAPSQADRLGIDTPGIYPLLVSLRVDGAVVARHGTVLHRVGPVAAVPTIDISAIGAVPQRERLDDDLGSRVEDAARLTEYAELSDQPIWLSIPPAVVAELTDGMSGRDLVVDALRDDTVQGLPATPFDISSAVAVDRDDAFISELTIGEAQLQTALPGVPVRRDVWFVDRPVSSEAAALLRSLGVRALAMTPDVARTTISPLPEDLADDRSIDISLPDGSTMTVLLIDQATDEFGPDATATARASGTVTEWAVQYLAELSLDAAEQGSNVVRGRLLAGDDLGPLDTTLLNELVRLDPTTEIHDVVDAGALATRISPQPLDEPALLPDVAGPSLVGRLDAIESTGLVIADASSMLPDDDDRLTEWPRALDSLVSTALTDEQADEVLLAIRDEAEQLTTSIVAPEPFSITLTSRTGTIPLTISNTSDEPLRVVVQLTSQRLRFPDGDPEVLLQPGANEIEIPVEARTNGTTSVEVVMSTPLGGPLTETVRVSTRVQALSGLAQLLTATLLLLLLTWWLNHWRARRDLRLGGATPPSTSSGGAPNPHDAGTATEPPTDERTDAAEEDVDSVER